MNCIFCLGDTVRNGKDRQGRQRFKCCQNHCGKSFTLISNSPTIISKKRLTIHLLVAGCDISDIATKLELEERLVKIWKEKYLSNLSAIKPREPLLSINTLLTIFKAIEKKRISKLNYSDGIKSFRRRSKFF